jgi:flavin-dependent dehydrogenase
VSLSDSKRFHGLRDVAIVGGGPAGLATAIAARARGLDAVVFEASPSGAIDKACGEGLMPAGVRALAALGVDAGRVGRGFAGIRFLDGATVAEGRFRDGRGVGVRRLALHQALEKAALACGVELRRGCRVEHVDSDGRLRVDGREVAARFVVGADGLLSRVRRWVGLAAPEAGIAPRQPHGRRFGVRRHFVVPPWSDFVEVTWSPAGEAYVTPVGDELVGVALLWRDGRHGGGEPDPGVAERISFDRRLEHFPELARRLAGCEFASRDRGAGPLRQRARGGVCGRVLLVGDAGGYVDAITGEGLALAFEEALAAADAMAREDLASFRRTRRRIRRAPEALTFALLAAERRPALRRFVIRTLARVPGLFDRLLGVHAGHLPLPPPASMPGPVGTGWKSGAAGDCAP